MKPIPKIKLDINNFKSVKMFNKVCALAWYHSRKRIRKKNYVRAKKLLNIRRFKKQKPQKYWRTFYGLSNN